ncbi:PEP/pyruvate-binding domain-containing protein [Streptomyces sp. NPDC059533]|uniref:PEP/pyruvate-binding domain-containing protein n=1 Tax=unclassified Streptomyces TaxID=2593676 RepID=UPI0036CC3368
MCQIVLNPVIDVRIGAKRRKAVYAEHGLTDTVDATRDERDRRVLTDAEVRRLAEWAVAVEDHYGCPMAMVSRELGVPAVVGTGNATELLRDGADVTISCTEGSRGRVYAGRLPYEEKETDLSALPATRTRVMLNLADPSAAFRWWRLPADGVGLARVEFIVAHQVKVHPTALLHPERLDTSDRCTVDQLTEGPLDRGRYFTDRLAYGIARIAASRRPDPVVVRTSDFKTSTPSSSAAAPSNRWRPTR